MTHPTDDELEAMAVRSEAEIEPELRRTFYFIEKLISQYDKDAET